MVEQPVVGAGCSTIYEGTPTAVARIADKGGVDTLWVADHLLQADQTSKPEEPMPAC